MPHKEANFFEAPMNDLPRGYVIYRVPSTCDTILKNFKKILSFINGPLWPLNNFVFDN